MKVVLFGLGAIGSNLFISLLRQFPDWEFVGVDFDKIEDRNLRTQAYFKERVGMPKATALTVLGNRYVNKLKYTPVNVKIRENTVIDRTISVADLWVDCFDNSLSRSLLKELVSTACIDVDMLHLGFSPLYSAECIWDANYDVPNDVDAKHGDICSMADAVGFMQMFIGLAVMNISAWVQTREKKDFLVMHKNQIRQI